MIDIKRIIDEREKVEEGLLKRMEPESLDLDGIVNVYNEKLEAQRKFEQLRAHQNSFNDKMAEARKNGQDTAKMLDDLKNLATDVKAAENHLRELDEQLTAKLEVLPNVPDEDVVSGEKEANEILETYGEKPKFDFDIKDHLEIAEGLGILDFERGAKLGGSQMPMYVGDGALLEWALLTFFIKEHIKDGYTMIMPPHLLVEESAYTAGQLPKFKDDVYWTQDGLCLLPTAETALANLYRDETLLEEQLPIKLFAYTPCYRKEAGGYRTNERGLMRMHQFNKVEIFHYTTDEKSEESLEELTQKAKEITAKLGLHYNLVKLAAGDCSAGMAKTLDVEVYMPAFDKYQEVSSISNARDYQTRRGNIRFKPADGSKPRFAHTLNASALATSRLGVAILETYQNADGSVTVPEVLREFMGKDKIEKQV